MQQVHKRTDGLLCAGSKKNYFDILDDVVDKYNNTYHNTIKMKPIHVKSMLYWVSMVKKLLELFMKNNCKEQIKKMDATEIDTPKLAAKLDLASLKAKVDEIDVEKLKTVSVDLSKLSNVVNNDVVKKTLYGKLVDVINLVKKKIIMQKL